MRLIRAAKDRGHRAYKTIDMDSVEKKAARLPEDGVPPEIVALLPHDSTLDQVLVQKAAAPVPGRGSVEQEAERLRNSQPNAVVEEKSSNDAADINAQRIAALRNLATQLRPEIEDDTQGSSPHLGYTREVPHADPDSSPPPTKMKRLAIITGSQMVDQLSPCISA